jgi:hypothetical protein
MKLALIGYGTRSDVQPMLCLAWGLQQRGHEVRLLALSARLDCRPELRSVAQLAPSGFRLARWLSFRFLAHLLGLVRFRLGYLGFQRRQSATNLRLRWFRFRFRLRWPRLRNLRFRSRCSARGCACGVCAVRLRGRKRQFVWFEDDVVVVGVRDGGLVLDQLVTRIIVAILSARSGLDEVFSQLLGQVVGRVVDEPGGGRIRAVFVAALFEQLSGVTRIEMSSRVSSPKSRLGRILDHGERYAMERIQQSPPGDL